MATLAQKLPLEIARLEQKFGPDNPFVQQLKQQLATIQKYGDSSTKEIWMTQAREFPPAGDPTPPEDPQQIPAYDLNNLPVDPALAAGSNSESLYPEQSDTTVFTAAKKKRGKQKMVKVRFNTLKTEEGYRKHENYSVGTFYRVSTSQTKDKHQDSALENQEVDPMADAVEIIEKWGRKEAQRYGGKGKKNG